MPAIQMPFLAATIRRIPLTLSIFRVALKFYSAPIESRKIHSVAQQILNYSRIALFGCEWTAQFSFITPRKSNTPTAIDEPHYLIEILKEFIFILFHILYELLNSFVFFLRIGNLRGKSPYLVIIAPNKKAVLFIAFPIVHVVYWTSIWLHFVFVSGNLFIQSKENTHENRQVDIDGVDFARIVIVRNIFAERDGNYSDSNIFGNFRLPQNICRSSD